MEQGVEELGWHAPKVQARPLTRHPTHQNRAFNKNKGKRLNMSDNSCAPEGYGTLEGG